MSSRLVSVVVAMLALLPGARAHYWNVPSGADCIVQEYRKPEMIHPAYDALYQSGYVVTGERPGAWTESGWYGGAIHRPEQGLSTVFFSFWRPSLAFPPEAVQRFVYAAPGGTWATAIGEGTVGNITTIWPLFATNRWYRFALRFWQPADGTPHRGFQGMWMRDPRTAQWHHLGTVEYPMAVSGVDGLGGFQEGFASVPQPHVAEYRGVYYHREGAWHAADRFETSNQFDVTAIDDGTAVSSRAKPFSLPFDNVHYYHVLTNQPPLPALDPIRIERASAWYHGSNLVVEWVLHPTSSPQLGHRIAVRPGADEPVAWSRSEAEPQTRQVHVAAPDPARAVVELEVNDIFHQTHAPVRLVPRPATPLAAVPEPARLAPGLNYAYFEAPAGVAWTRLPDMTGLAPRLSGAVNHVDVTPRRRRDNYAFQFTGYLRVDEPGMHLFAARAGAGCRIHVADRLVIDADAPRNATQEARGWVALEKGLHAFRVEYFQETPPALLERTLHDAIAVLHQGPSGPLAELGSGDLWRVASVDEPVVTLLSPRPGTSVDPASTGFTSAITPANLSVRQIEYLLSAEDARFFHHPSRTVAYSVGTASSGADPVPMPPWTWPRNTVRARLHYGENRTLDSAEVPFASLTPDFGDWVPVTPEVHNYPSGLSIREGRARLGGDGLVFLARPLEGDGTLTARLVGRTPLRPGPDGESPDARWRAGLLLRGSTNLTMGTPLGDGQGTRFFAVFVDLSGQRYFEDHVTSRAPGTPNHWTPVSGPDDPWFRLERRGDTFIASVSHDGLRWSAVHTNLLPGFPKTVHAGPFLHAVQSGNPNLHFAEFDAVSVVGPGVTGAAEIHVHQEPTPATPGHPVRLVASHVGAGTPGVVWEREGVPIPGATNLVYEIPTREAGHPAEYAFVVPGQPKVLRRLVWQRPLHSGIWTQPAGGRWLDPIHWSDSHPVDAPDAFADLEALDPSMERRVAIDAPIQLGTLLLGSRESTEARSRLEATSAGRLRLGASNDLPVISTFGGTHVLALPLEGTQGLRKTGAGTLILAGPNPFTGSVVVEQGVLEVQAKSPDVPFRVEPGATLRLGYSNSGASANVPLDVWGGGADDKSGLEFRGGTTFHGDVRLRLHGHPTRVRTYGEGEVWISDHDLSTDAVQCDAEASGSSFDERIRWTSFSWGVSLRVDPGSHHATGDLVLDGPLAIPSAGLAKRGLGSIRLNHPAFRDNLAVQIFEGSLLCGARDCVGTNALLRVDQGCTALLGGTSQTVAALAGSGQILGGSPAMGTLTVVARDDSEFAGRLGNTNQFEDTFHLVKDGPAMLRLRGKHAFVGDTLVRSGHLVVVGSLASREVDVASQGRLSASGQFDGNLVVRPGAELALAGDEVATLEVRGDAALQGTTRMRLESHPGGMVGDMLSSAGTLSLGGSLQVMLASSTPPAEGDSIRLFESARILGDFTAIALPPLPPSLRWDHSRLRFDGTLRVIRGDLRVSFAYHATHGLRLEFEADPGRTYVLEHAPALPASGWTEVARILAPAVGGLARLEDADPDRTRRASGFYRIRRD